MWMGVSPVVLAVNPSLVQMLQVRKEGYFDTNYTLTYDAPELLSLSLRKQIVDPVEWQERKRRTFYTSLGIWVLSVPLPIFAYAGAADSALASGNATGDEYDRLRRRTELFYYTYWATLFASGVLFVNMLRDLLEYVRYADESPY
jgi:hypothetical protein